MVFKLVIQALTKTKEKEKRSIITAITTIVWKQADPPKNIYMSSVLVHSSGNKSKYLMMIHAQEDLLLFAIINHFELNVS